ncbi:L-seryl-tRNA(Sec) selenium transferase [Micromonospora pattaloongensis]|uniref:L-seryl-tRNA(Sec) selenium transferase n=1 Tax=Micromonospora pattaloongensis TaxID=405436 RepID=A0A1H3NXH8_9ACTN|nr:L-seryl-tRNA(Sec) selenium transferase [Micromonospora pattaloongensis]SDY93235.1 L-seryl-tRNA(Sec) selenium transferase [Micromonospora pattaloongensis]
MAVGAPDPRRRVPRTDALLADPRLVAAAGSLGRARVKAAVAAAQERARRGEISPEEVAAAALATLPAAPGGLRPVINATGVVLHTNLGRAPLSAAAVDAVVAAAGHTDVELDLTTGRRARRGRGAMAALAAATPDAGAVHVVNNGAAALVLAATALATDREIIVSRGELVEIGDGFRLPDLLESTGARLREVGTTNRTTLADYAAALGPRTGFILKVHPSNFVVSGFTSAVPVAALATLDAPVVVDIGSGLLAPDPLLPDEPDAASALRAGAALVTASGDKLLGGPQAGLLLGVAELVERLRRHPLARALRVDKLTLAALDATLQGPETPTRQALRAGAGELRERAERLRDELSAAGHKAEVVPTAAVVGGGGAPGVELPSWAVALPERYATQLRLGEPPVVGRVERGRCLLDLRCVPSTMDDAVRDAVLRLPRTGD